MGSLTMKSKAYIIALVLF